MKEEKERLEYPALQKEADVAWKRAAKLRADLDDAYATIRILSRLLADLEEGE